VELGARIDIQFSSMLTAAGDELIIARGIGVLKSGCRRQPFRSRLDTVVGQPES